ncbi:O-methyltransferase [Thermobifida halotolerans]|uniref:O-methyltransferase n=1 Tax=Thermobifida halotolerans TaxID=483545 RepID=A0A399G016_9ACTN|nr:O-methyltransferase [Thermobifida halotolerans]UOE22218.1 O-methyltransferase [Thermobifida halotolerans]
MERYAVEDDALAAAREQGRHWDVRPVSPTTGAALRFLATVIGARAVVEIGTGCGSSGLWLLRGMRPDSVLTTVDVDPASQQFARGAYRRAGFAANRTRLIHGRALEVLPRLRDAAYDMVFLDSDRAEYPAYLAEALRVLRPGGIVVYHGALDTDGVRDGPLEAAADPAGAAVRELGRLVHEDETLVPLLLPVGAGLLAAVSTA